MYVCRNKKIYAMINLENDVVNPEHAISRWTHHLLSSWGLNDSLARVINLLLLLTILVILVYLGQVILRKILWFAFARAQRVSKLSFFGHLIKARFPHYLALLAPYNIIRNSIPVIFSILPKWISPLVKVIDLYLILIIIWGLMSFFRASFGLLQEKPAFKDKPIRSYLQVILIILSIFGLIASFSIITGKSPVTFFAAMGAASAILLLVFKDTIMGFVASVQITTNDMVRINDWITMPKYGADGDVIDINLTTVMVQNFDKTITTIPTYALISDSFQNWRGMVNSGGRRIKRSITIKQSSIRYIAEEELPRFREIQGIAAYIDDRQKEISEHNKRIGADKSVPINGRNLTNGGLFRKYIDWYLQNHPGIQKEMTLMVRQLAPSELGLPLEIYAFTTTTKWAQYEYIMADIFDHLIAASNYFDLQIFELETGSDVQNIVINDIRKAKQ